MTVVNYAKHNCPIAQTLSVLGDQWTLLIVRDALSGLRRFGEFQRSLSISRNWLTRRLTQLTEQGVLRRVAIPDSKRFAYEPTEKCLELRTVIIAMAEWGEKWRADPKGPRVEVLEKRSGRPVSLRFYEGEDGIVVEPGDVTVIRLRQNG